MNPCPSRGICKEIKTCRFSVVTLKECPQAAASFCRSLCFEVIVLLRIYAGNIRKPQIFAEWFRVLMIGAIHATSKIPWRNKNSSIELKIISTLLIIFLIPGQMQRVQCGEVIDLCLLHRYACYVWKLSPHFFKLSSNKDVTVEWISELFAPWSFQDLKRNHRCKVSAISSKRRGMRKRSWVGLPGACRGPVCLGFGEIRLVG